MSLWRSLLDWARRPEPELVYVRAEDPLVSDYEVGPIDIKRGDKFVIMYPGALHMDQKARIIEQFQHFIESGQLVFVMDREFKLLVLRNTEALNGRKVEDSRESDTVPL